MTGNSIQLEVPIASVDDALAATAGGANRLELNAALPLGGLTPSLGTLIEVKRASPLPVIVMIRPRSGGFNYSEAEFRGMRRDLDLALEHGADGIAFGILTETGGIDSLRCRQLVQQIGSRQIVFHRAFDVTPDPFAALEQLIDLGVQRIMTSGQEATAVQGLGLIADLLHRARGRVEILPAGGIKSSNVAELVNRTGCTQIHASLRGHRADHSTAARPQVSFGKARNPSEDQYDATDQALVKDLIYHLRKLPTADG